MISQRFSCGKQSNRSIGVVSVLLLAGLAGTTTKPHAHSIIDNNRVTHESRLSLIKRDIPDLDAETTLPIILYIPNNSNYKSAGVVLLPGLMASVDQYESYSRDLAKEGFIVAAHSWYSPLTSDEELAREANVIADWLRATFRIDRHHIGVVGHSMGAKDAILSASRYGGFAAIVAIDPDDSGDVSAVDSHVANLRAPLLLIGAEVAWQAPDICAPLEENYQRFFERAPNGTIELTLRNADHVQVLDDPDRFGYNICRTGTADSRQVLNNSRRATAAFFVQHLLGGTYALPRMYSENTSVRVANMNAASNSSQVTSLPADVNQGTATGTCSSTC